MRIDRSGQQALEVKLVFIFTAGFVIEIRDAWNETVLSS